METLLKHPPHKRLLFVYSSESNHGAQRYRHANGYDDLNRRIPGGLCSSASLCALIDGQQPPPTCDALILDLQQAPQLGLSAMTALYNQLPECPILVLTEDIEVAHQALCQGAQAHLQPSELEDADHLQKVLEDSLNRKDFEQRALRYQYSDPLTGLANRAGFLQCLEQALRRSREDDSLVSLLFVNLDNFKVVNSALGHRLGDKLLCEAAQRMQSCLGSADLLAHTGGDEFAVVMEVRNDINDVTLTAQSLLQAFQSPIKLNTQDVYVGLSIGIAVSCRGEEDASTLLQQANIALQKAKAKRESQVEYFTPELAAAARVQMELFTSLRQAQDRREMFLVYQPQIDINSGEVHGAEALLRWQHPTMGLVSPALFVPILEQIGTIHQVGGWVIREACRLRKQLDLSELLPKHATIAVNLSMRQFSDPQLIQKIRTALDDVGIEPHQLDIELTESLLMEDVDGGVEKLNQLKELGVRLSLDDFGTGYSSLSYLKQFPLDVLKIDQSFVACSARDKRAASIIRAIVSLAHNLNFSVIAEGVETEEQLEFLQREGCDFAQGYLISKPVDEKAFQHFLASSSDRPAPADNPYDTASIPVFGDCQIDSQHQRLFTLLDNLANATDRTDAEEMARASLEDLLTLANNHFAAEERLMRRIHYPGILRHQHEHLRMKQQLKTIRDRYHQGNAVLTKDLIELLRSWIVGHVHHSDRKIVEFQSQLQQGGADQTDQP